MRKMYSPKPILTNSLALAVLAVSALAFSATGVAATGADQQVDATSLQMQIPTLGNIMTFVIRGFFVITGLVAMLYLMYGAFSWVASGGKEEKIAEARGRIQAAVVGVILVFAMLAVITTLEQVVFAKKLCFGLSCPASIPGLAKECVSGYDLTVKQYSALYTPGKAMPAQICCTKGVNKVSLNLVSNPGALTPPPAAAPVAVTLCKQ